MTDTIMAYRVNGGHVEMVCDDTGDPFVFQCPDEAVAYAISNALFKSGQADYQIIVLDEL